MSHRGVKQGARWHIPMLGSREWGQPQAAGAAARDPPAGGWRELSTHQAMAGDDGLLALCAYAQLLNNLRPKGV